MAGQPPSTKFALRSGVTEDRGEVDGVLRHDDVDVAIGADGAVEVRRRGARTRSWCLPRT